MNRSPLVDWWFRNRSTGAITIAQFPNIAMWVVVGAAVGRRLGLIIAAAGVRSAL